MVKILSNGDIVPDNDTRAKQKTSQGSSSPDGTRPRRGFVQNAPDQEPHYHMPQTGSIFDTLNDRLLAAGVPRWNLGPYPVEPIVSLGFLVALLLIGFSGLLLGLLLFFVCKWSGVGSGTGGGQAAPGVQGWRGGGAALGGQGPAPGGGGGGGAAAQGGRDSGSSVRGGPSPRGSWSGGGQKLGRS